MSESDIRNERLKKLDRLKEAGMDPYPAKAEPSATIADLLVEFEGRAGREERASIVGRVMAKRGQGGIAFLDIFDGTAKMQAVVQKDDLPEQFDLFTETVDIGDFIEITGIAYLTKRGEKSVKSTSWRMISKSLLPIPDSWYGLKDEEKILRERYLDVLLNDETRAMIERRAKFWQTIRNFYLERGFMEADTPVLESTPGGADARPFETHHNALDIPVSLRISLELWLKRLLVAGFPKVFEIGRIFRNEGQSREHLQDYTQWESYEAYKDMRDGMAFVQELYRRIAKDVYGKYSFEINGHAVDLAENWDMIDFCAVIRERFGIDPLNCSEEEAIQAVRDAQIQVGEQLNKARAIDYLWKSIRKTIAGPAFLVGVPVYLEPLAKRVAGNPDLVERFQVILAGSEMGKGFSELNDPQDQRARFEEQEKMRDAGDDEAQRLDEDYVRAMEYGMPPSFGFGMSERLFSFLENRPAHETQIFPLLRPKEEVKEGKSKKTMSAVIVLNKMSLEFSWMELNAAAHLAASFAAREGRRLFMQDSVSTKDGQQILLNIQYAIMIKTSQNSTGIRQLMNDAKERELTAVPFTREMLETTDDRKVAAFTKQLNATELEYLGVLVFGDRKTVEAATESFPLHD